VIVQTFRIDQAIAHDHDAEGGAGPVIMGLPHSGGRHNKSEDADATGQGHRLTIGWTTDL
jgi:hypothetical protein